MELTKSQFDCNQEYVYEYLISATQYNMSSQGSAFFIDSRGMINSSDNEFKNCFDAVRGGVFNIQQANL